MVRAQRPGGDRGSARIDDSAPGSLALALWFLSGLRLVFNTGQRFVYPFLPVIARGLGVSLEQAGLLVSARWAAGLATPAVVSLSGRAEARRRLVVLGTVTFVAGATITAAVGVFAGALIGFALLGIAKPVFDIAAQSYIADRVPYRRRARYLSILELTWAGALLVGAPAAGWLIDRGSWQTPFWVLAALAAASLLGVWFVLEGDGAAPSTARPRLTPTRSAVALLVVAGLFMLAAEIMFVVFGAWLEDGFGLSILALGGVATLIGVAELIGEGATMAFTDRLGKRRAVAIGLVVSTIGFASLVGTSSSLGLGLATMAVALLGFEFTIVSTIPLATEVAPGARARYLSWLIVATGLGRAVGSALGPVLFSVGGLAVNASVAAVADVVALVMVLTLVGDDGQAGAAVSTP